MLKDERSGDRGCPMSNICRTTVPSKIFQTSILHCLQIQAHTQYFTSRQFAKNIYKRSTCVYQKNFPELIIFLHFYLIQMKEFKL